MDKFRLRRRIAELEALLAARPPEPGGIYRTLTQSQLAAQAAALREAMTGFQASLDAALAEQARRRLQTHP